MEDELLQALRDFVATANSGKYSDEKELMSKFPELQGYDKNTLRDFVVTTNSGKYNSEEELLSKFPEFTQKDAVKKKVYSNSTSTNQKSVSEAEDTGGISDSTKKDKTGIVSLDASEIENDNLQNIIQTIEETKLNDERINEIKSEIDEKYETSQGFAAQSIAFLGKIARPFTLYTMDEDFEEAAGNLHEEIEIAKQQLKKDGIKDTDPEYDSKVLQRAKDIKLVELVTAERDAKVRNYLSNLPEEQKQKALDYSKNKMIALDSDLSNSLLSLKMYEKSIKDVDSEINDIQNEKKLLSNRIKEITEEVRNGVDEETKRTLKIQYDNVINRINELQSLQSQKINKFNSDISKLEEVRDRGIELADEYGNFVEQVDYLKRSYGFLENIGDKWANAWFTISSNFQEAIAYSNELLGNEEAYRKFNEESEALKKTVARSSEFMEKPYSIKDVSTPTDFIKYSGNTIVEQSPYLIMGTSGYAAPFLFAVNASGAKAGEIDDMKYKDISPAEKATSVIFAGVSEGVLSSFGTIRNIRKAKKTFKSIGRVDRKKGYREIIKDVREGMFNEIGEELGVEFLDAGNNYLMLDDEKAFDRFNDSFADITFSSGIFGGMTRVSPHVVGLAHSVYSSTNQKIKINKYQKKIDSLVNIINNSSLPKEDIDNAIGELALKLNESIDYIQSNLNKISSLSKTDKKRVGKIYYEVSQLKNKANKVKNDNKIKDEDKKVLLDKYKQNSKNLLDEKDSILKKYEEIKETGTTPETEQTTQTQELSEKRRQVVQALRDIEENTDKEKVDNANKILKDTPKKLRESAKNQKIREDVELKVNDALNQGESKEEILDMFEGKEKEIAEDVIVRSEPSTEESRAKSFEETLDKAEKDREKMSKSKFTYSNILKAFKERFLDRTSFAKDIFKKAKLRVNNTALVDYMIADGGSSGRAKEIFKNVYNKVYYKLTNDDVKILDRIIQAKRLIDLEKQRKDQDKSDVINFGFENSETANSWLNILKKKIGEEKFNEMNDRAEEFFSYYQDMLKEMYDEGFIDKQMYESFKGYDYVQRKFLQHIEDVDGNFDYSKASDDSSLAKSPIKTITQGSSESLLTDSMLLISMYINARSKSVSANRINKATYTSLLQAKERQKSLQDKKDKGTITKGQQLDLNALNKLFDNVNLDSKTPDNFKKVYYYENGKRKSFNMKPDFYDSYAGQMQGIISTPNIRETVSLLSGKSILQSFATGNNPTFFITNTPRDLSFISIFSSQYSNFLLKALGQITKDLAGGIKEIRKGTDNSYIYKNAVDYGLMMNFLHTQGRVKRNTFVDKLNKKVFDNFFKVITFGTADSKRSKDFVFKNKLFEFINDLQEYGEIGFRVGIFTRTIKNEINNLKKQNYEKYKNLNKIEDLENIDKSLKESIFTKAVAEARAKSSPDFNQSGTILKDIDALIPYLNAATQSIKVSGEQFAERPLSTTFRLVQASALLGSVPIGLSVFLLGQLNDDELPEEYRGLTGVERYLMARQRQSVYQNSNYMHFYYDISKEGEFKSFRLAKSHEITPVLTITENILANNMAKMYGVENYQDKTLEEVKFTFEKNVIPFDLSPKDNLSKIPLVNSIFSYSLGYDFYRNQPLSYMQGRVRVPAEGFESDYIEPFYKKIGWQTTESPARLKGAIEAIVTSPRSNPYVSLTYGGADAILGGKEGRRKGEIVKNIKQMFVGRLFSKTSKYAPSVNLTLEQQKELDKIAQQKMAKSFNYDKVINEYIKNDAVPQDVVDEIILQSEKSPEEVKKLVNKLKKELKENKYPFVVQKMKNMDAPERAFMLYNIFGGDFKDKSNEKILKQLVKAKVLNKQTVKEYNKLLKGLKTGDFDYNYEYMRKNLNK